MNPLIRKPLVAALGAAAAIVSLPSFGGEATAAEKQFIEEAIRGNVAEVRLGELAQERGQSEAVREYGEKLAEDHARALDDSVDLAKDVGMIPPAEPTDKQLQEYDALAKLSGAQFDSQFASHMVMGHQQEIAKYEKQAAGQDDSDVADYAENQLPALREHLAMAQKIQRGDTHDQHSSDTRSDSRDRSSGAQSVEERAGTIGGNASTSSRSSSNPERPDAPADRSTGAGAGSGR